jgi:DNA-binding NtrC family response regulator
MLIAEILQRHGFSVSVAWRVDDALAMIADDHFDVAIVDVSMPDVTGPQFADRLHASDPSTKVVFCTGYLARLVEARPTLQDTEMYLEKPFTMTSLVDVVKSAADPASS